MWQYSNIDNKTVHYVVNTVMKKLNKLTAYI